jgi:hypothetical protein
MLDFTARTKAALAASRENAVYQRIWLGSWVATV